MDRKLAGALFIGVCAAVLAILMLTGIITPLVGCSAFAVALVVLGLLSGGFRKRTGSL